MRSITACRICRSSNLVEVLDLGVQPLANEFVKEPRPQTTYPLVLLRCVDCGLAQLSIAVDPEVMFRNYLYASSATPSLVAHFEEYAEEVSRRFAPPGSFVIEIGSNDGVLLAPLKARGIGVLGIEPAENLAAVAKERGIATWNEFFSAKRFRRFRWVFPTPRANVIIANNVLAHIDDIHEVMRGVCAALRDDGVFIAEFPYLGDLIERVEYDTIYHEHLSYFSLRPLERLFGEYGMRVFDIKHLPQQGGSIRVYVCRTTGEDGETTKLRRFRDREFGRWLDDPWTYDAFADKVVASRRALVGMLGRLANDGKFVAAFGASAKGNTLLNYCGIGPTYIDFIADGAPLKHGLYTPGTHIPVLPESALAERNPDYVLLLAWNYADAIAAKYPQLRGRFIHPIPLARLV